MRTCQICTTLFLLSFIGGDVYGQSPLYNSPPAQVNYWRAYNPNSLDRMAVEIGTIGLVREVPDQQTLAFDSLANPILDANSMQGPMHFGTKAMIDFRDVRSWFGGTDLQFGYFGINSLDKVTAVSADEVYAHFYNGFPQDPQSSYDFLYSSNLYSGEANLRFGSRNRIRPIAGLRYFKLEDTYDVYHDSSGTIGGFFSLVNNSLFGGQIGLEGDLWQSRRVNWYGFAKVAAMHNEIEGSATAANAYHQYTDSTYITLVDAGTGANIHVAGPLSFRVGYRSLFASALALGIDQNEAFSIIPPPSGAVKFNSQQWHGIDLAAIFQF